MAKPAVHVLKAWPEFFQEIVTGKKTAELRRDDRHFRMGDTLMLLEFDPAIGIYTGCTCVARVTGVLRNFEGLCKGFCVLSIKLPPGATRFQTDLAGVNPGGSKFAVMAKRKTK